MNPNERKEGESFEAYKERRRNENYIEKRKKQNPNLRDKTINVTEFRKDETERRKTELIRSLFKSQPLPSAAKVQKNKRKHRIRAMQKKVFSQ